MDGRTKCELVNKDLWDSFDFHGNEMIITKVGRRIFPSIDIKVSNLDPNKYYGLFLDFVRVKNNRYKYSPKLGWTVGRSSDTNHVATFYQHPESPALGSYWMSRTIVFDKVLFSNNVEVTQNVIILSSMHKYVPRIHIYEAYNSDSQFHRDVISFPETSFVAVTAYQNSQITELKVQNNKYANGHRIKHDQDKSKREEKVDNKGENLTKMLLEDDTEEDTCSEESEKLYESRTECYRCYPFPCFQPQVYPIRPEPTKCYVEQYELLPYKSDYKEFKRESAKNLSKNETHKDVVKSYTDFTIRKILNIK